MMARSRGWSGDITVSSVTPRNASVSTIVATVRPAASRGRTKRACLTRRAGSTFSQ